MKFTAMMGKPIRALSGLSIHSTQDVAQGGTVHATRSVPFLLPRRTANKEAGVAQDAKLQRLERQLSWNSPGPLGDIAAAGVGTALSVGYQLVASLRQATIGQPLTMLLLSFQAGYAMGRWGHRHAPR
jgi:hypothetical protein